MTSAIVMAGYNNRREVKKYSRIVAEHYGEKFIETGYKPLREFKSVKNGRQVIKPLIQYTLERLAENRFIHEVVIVGHQMLLEHRLGNFIQNFEKRISHKEIAQVVGVSTNYLSTLFSKETGQTLHQFINSVRIEKAKELLDQGNLNITEIGWKVGFNRLDHFSRTFESFAGCSPMEYRKRKIS